jgi:hypothetical protein
MPLICVPPAPRLNGAFDPLDNVIWDGSTGFDWAHWRRGGRASSIIDEVEDGRRGAGVTRRGREFVGSCIEVMIHERVTERVHERTKRTLPCKYWERAIRNEELQNKEWPRSPNSDLCRVARI